MWMWQVNEWMHAYHATFKTLANDAREAFFKIVFHTTKHIKIRTTIFKCNHASVCSTFFTQFKWTSLAIIFKEWIPNQNIFYLLKNNWLIRILAPLTFCFIPNFRTVAGEATATFGTVNDGVPPGVSLLGGIPLASRWACALQRQKHKW